MTLVISQKRSPLVSKAKKPIKKKKKPKNYYFNQTTENAIIRYNNTDDVNLKNFKTCVAAYKKKQEFNGGYLEINNMNCENYYKEVNIDVNSKILKNYEF